MKLSRSQQSANNNLSHAPSRRISLYERLVFNRTFFAAAAKFSDAAPTTAVDNHVISKSQPTRNDHSVKTSKQAGNSNIFLDNLGKMFLSSIVLVLVMLLRSTKSNNSQTALRDDIESSALLDPLEIDDLRSSNSDFTIEVWEKIVQKVRRQFASRGHKATYPEFLSVVKKTMQETKGDRCTIELGYLLDRVVIAELERMGEENHTVNSTTGGKGEEDRILRKQLPLPFLFAVLSLALQTPVTDRVGALFESMLIDEMDTTPVEETSPTVPSEQVSQMIEFLQSTSQLPSKPQIVETNSKTPFQTFRVATGDELTQRARGDKNGPVSLEEFTSILKSAKVCAWGECYGQSH